MRLTLQILTLFRITILQFAVMVLSHFVLKKKTLTSLPIAHFLASKPLLSFRKAYFVQDFQLKSVPLSNFFTGFGSNNKSATFFFFLLLSYYSPVLAVLSSPACFFTLPFSGTYGRNYPPLSFFRNQLFYITKFCLFSCPNRNKDCFLDMLLLLSYRLKALLSFIPL